VLTYNFTSIVLLSLSMVSDTIQISHQILRLVNYFWLTAVHIQRATIILLNLLIIYRFVNITTHTFDALIDPYLLSGYAYGWSLALVIGYLILSGIVQWGIMIALLDSSSRYQLILFKHR